MAAQNSRKAGGRGKPPEGRRFQKGQSGNPGGRPKEIGALKELAREHTTASIETLVRNLTAKSRMVQVVAANSILDRGYGKASQHIELDAGDELIRRLNDALKRNGGG